MRSRQVLPAIAVALAASLAVAADVAAEPVLGAPQVLPDSRYFVNADLAQGGFAGSGYLARAAVGPTGTTAVGYQTERSPFAALLQPAVAVRRPGGTWSTRTFTGKDHEGYSFVGVDRRDRVTAVWWNATDGGEHVTQTARHRADGTWTRRRTLRGVTGRPTSFDVAPSGYGVVTFVWRRNAYAKVLTPRGTWRPRVRLSGHRVGEGVSRVAAVVSDRGAVTAAFFSITEDTRGGTYGLLQRGGLTAQGRRLRVVDLAADRLADLPVSVVGSPGGSAAVRVDEYGVAFRLAGDRWRRAARRNVAVAVTDGAVTVADLTPGTGQVQAYTLSDYRAATRSWTTPRVVATFPETQQVGGFPSGLDLVRVRGRTYLGFTVFDTVTATHSSRLVTDVAGSASITEVPDCLFDLAARGSSGALLTVATCQPGGRVSVTTW